MLTYILIIIYFSSFVSKYIALSHKDLDLDIDDICYYCDGQNTNDLNIYKTM